ncbi:MAG TPA: SAM-dependent methyltransferase [Verrucomicrobiae bacterium]|nr:SAM-dependent methyltransferase [Verrucomicrobiae bacterium]
MPETQIHREIELHGSIPFARFMELALYCPDFGYYETKKDIGKHGDFYTSVSVGNLFGELLAFQLAAWLEEARSAGCQPRIVESGAHDGTLAKDILTWLQSCQPKLFEQIEYVIIEPSARRQQWQKQTLKDFPNAVWVSDLENLKSKIKNSKLSGVIFGNELLDAFPVHRFGWNAQEKKWFEWNVAIQNKKFVWKKTIQPPTHGLLRDSIPGLPPELLDVLPDNYTIEASPAAANWWRDAAELLSRGKLLALDYGYTVEEQFSPARLNGTLRAYCSHRVTDDVLANPGEQDLTAHVNFSAIQKTGKNAGLKTEFFSTQTKFLTQILQRAVAEKSFGWNASRARQFQTLTHPDHLGRAFRVLLQSRE